MATISETLKNNSQATQDTLRQYVTESTALGRNYLSAWSTAMQTSLRAAFELQNASLQASRAMFDSSVQMGRSWLDQAGESVRQSQEATAKLVNASLGLAESAWPNGKA